MKILMVVDNEFSPDIRVNNESVVFSRNQHSVKVLCLNYGNLRPFENYHGVEIYRIPLLRKAKNLLFFMQNTIDLYSNWWSKRIINFVRKNSVDILYVHDLYLSKAGRKAATVLGLTFVLDLHENYPAAVTGYRWMNRGLLKFITKPRKWGKLEKKYLEYPDSIVVLSKEYKQKLIEQHSGLNPNDIFVFPNVPNLQEIPEYLEDPDFKKGKDELILFYFGGISERRGIFFCMKAMRDLVKQYPNIRLLLIGPVDNAEKVCFFRKLEEMSDYNITYFPWKDMKFLPYYINISDICLSPIHKNEQHEAGVANKVFQYMRFGGPLIVSDCLPQKSVIEEIKCGVSFQSGNKKDYIDKVVYLLNDIKLRDEMSKNGKMGVTKKYNTFNFSNGLLQMIEHKKNVK